VFSSPSGNKYIKKRLTGHYIKVSCSDAETGHNLIITIKTPEPSKLAFQERGPLSAQGADRRPQEQGSPKVDEEIEGISRTGKVSKMMEGRDRGQGRDRENEGLSRGTASNQEDDSG
jgi:hypothetical protein